MRSWSSKETRKHGRIHPTQEGGYTYNRLGFILPGLRGHNENQGMSLTRFLPAPVRNLGLTGMDPKLQLRSGRVVPYILHVEGQGITSGVGFGPFQGNFKVSDHWFSPTIRVLGQWIAGPKAADDRTVALTYKLTSSHKKEIQVLSKKLDTVGREVARIANEQRSAFHGNEKGAATKFKKKTNRKGMISQIEDLAVAAKTERADLKNLVQQGFEETEKCCIRQSNSIGKVDKKLVESVEAFAPLADLQRTASQLLGLFNGAQTAFFIIVLFLGFTIFFGNGI